MKKRVVLVSSYPFSLSSRGMDVLTQCFYEEEWDTQHLTFPRAFYTPQRVANPGYPVVGHYPKRVLIPYVDRAMHWIPSFLFHAIRRNNLKTIENFDFSRYDMVVIESGKPLFILDQIPKKTKIIYRQSDSVRLVLGRNRDYIALEEKAFEQSDYIVLKKQVYLNYLNDEQKKKAVVIENGMAIPENVPEKSPFMEGTLNAVYVGLHQLDYQTLDLILKQHKNVNFHIIGPCLIRSQINRLEKHSNFIYYSFLTRENYMPMLKFADFAIFPFKQSEKMKWFGLTSKFLHFMFFNLPIVSYPTGVEGEFDNLPVRFCRTKEEFSKQIEEVVREGKKINYQIDFNYYSNESRKNEYRRFIQSI